MSSALWWVTNGRADAPPWMVCSTGPSTSVNPRSIRLPADGGDRGVPDPEDLPGALVDLEVDVALPVAGLGVGQPAVLVRQRQQRLGEQLEVLHGDRELAPAGGHHGALDADPVAAVQLVELGVPRLAEGRGFHEELDGAGAVAQGGEAQPTVPADQHDPARHPHPVRGAGVRRQVAVRGPDVGGGVIDGVAERVRVRAAFADRFDLRPAVLALVPVIAAVRARPSVLAAVIVTDRFRTHGDHHSALSGGERSFRRTFTPRRAPRYVAPTGQRRPAPAPRVAVSIRFDRSPASGTSATSTAAATSREIATRRHSACLNSA